jgi:hypothetical protein
MNSLSDFFFLGTSIFMLRFAIIDWRRASATHPPTTTNLIINQPSISLIGAILNFIHFCGTFLNHASRCYIFHRLDVCGMWLVIFFFSFYFSTHNVLWSWGLLKDQRQLNNIGFLFKSECDCEIVLVSMKHRVYSFINSNDNIIMEFGKSKIFR